MTAISVAGTQAVLLAGGSGSRMPPLVSTDHPKALLTIANRPMLFYPLLSLLRAGFRRVTIVVEAQFDHLISTYCTEHFPADPAVKALGTSLDCATHVRAEDAGTADVLRELDLSATEDVLVLSADTIVTVDLRAVLATHRAAYAACTAAFLPAGTPSTAADAARDATGAKPAKGKKPSKKKPSSKPSAGAFTIDNYALLKAPDARLLGLYSTADISGGQVTVRAPLVRRYPSIHLRSDLHDPHIYFFNARVVSHVLKAYPNISSVKFDLVPYLARRQHTLTKLANADGWPYPGEEVRVFAHLLERGSYATRANTVTTFLETNMTVATGRLQDFLSGAQEAESDVGNVPGAGKKRAKKTSPRESPFKTAGERVSVTPDSLIGEGVSAGDRASVKRSVIGANCSLASNVKVNGCVILGGVTLKEGVNLSGCVVCDGVVIGKGCTLKDCRVARNVSIPDSTEESERDFALDLQLRII